MNAALHYPGNAFLPSPHPIPGQGTYNCLQGAKHQDRRGKTPKSGLPSEKGNHAAPALARKQFPRDGFGLHSKCWTWGGHNPELMALKDLHPLP